MINISFSKNDIKKLRRERYYNPHPIVQRKAEALLLKNYNLPHYKIAEIVGVCENTFRSYLKEYLEGGIDQIKEINYYFPQSPFKKYQQKIEDYFRVHPPLSIKQAASILEEITGIKRGLSQVRTFLRSLGLSRRKIGSIPAKVNVKKQEEFKKEILQPKLDEARKNKRTVFFVDAAHFVLAPFLGFVWSFTRLFIKAPAGRQRYNVLGALNAITKELITVTNDTYINAWSVIELMGKIRKKIKGPVSFILDNAKYQKCWLVRDMAAILNIELIYLPAYSPNLNLIERVWKFTKKHCLYSKYYQEFSSFRQVISDFLTTMHIKHKDELGSLLSLRFQTFKQTTLSHIYEK